MNYKSWDVYLNGKLIDTVFFVKGVTKDYVYRSLVEVDGYDKNIIVVKEF